MTKPQLDVTLQEGEMGVIEYPLNTPAFANIHSLSVFFVSTIPMLVERHLMRSHQSEAVGGEVTRLYYIGFKGDTRIPRKEGHSKLAIPAANAGASLLDRLQEKAKGQQPTAK